VIEYFHKTNRFQLKGPNISLQGMFIVALSTTVADQFIANSSLGQTTVLMATSINYVNKYSK
jgi:hypothetical protein